MQEIVREYIIEHVETPISNDKPLVFTRPIKSIYFVPLDGLNFDVTNKLMDTIESEVDSLYASIDIINEEVVVLFSSKKILTYIVPNYSYVITLSTDHNIEHLLPEFNKKKLEHLLSEFNEKKLEISSWGLSNDYIIFSGEFINNFIAKFNSYFNTTLDYVKNFRIPVNIPTRIKTWDSVY